MAPTTMVPRHRKGAGLPEHPIGHKRLVMIPPVTLRQLTYFIEAAQARSLMRAADALGVSQPAVTKTIRDLERNLDAQLFIRSRSGVELTPQGAAFLERATGAISEIRDGVSHLDALRNAERGHVRIGTLPIATSRLLPAAVARLKKTHPLVTVSLLPGPLDDLLSALKAGELDLVIGRRGEPQSMAGLVHEVLFEDRLAIVVDSNHRLAKRTKIALSDLVDEPWVLPNPNTAARHRLEEMFRDIDCPFPNNFVEGFAGSFATDYAREAQAVAALPNNIVAVDVARGRLVRLFHDTDATIGPTGITRREKLRLQPSSQLLITELRRVAKNLSLAV